MFQCILINHICLGIHLIMLFRLNHLLIIILLELLLLRILGILRKCSVDFIMVFALGIYLKIVRIVRF